MELPWIALALVTVIALERTRLRRLPARFLRAYFAADLAFFVLGAVALGLAMRTAAPRAPRRRSLWIRWRRGPRPQRSR